MAGARHIELGRLSVVVASSLVAALVPVALAGLTDFVSWSIWPSVGGAIVAAVMSAFVMAHGSSGVTAVRVVTTLVLVVPVVVIAGVAGLFVGWSEPLFLRLVPYVVATVCSGVALVRRAPQHGWSASVAWVLSVSAGLIDCWLFESGRLLLSEPFETFPARTVYATSTWTALWVGVVVAWVWGTTRQSVPESMRDAG